MVKFIESLIIMGAILWLNKKEFFVDAFYLEGEFLLEKFNFFAIFFKLNWVILEHIECEL